MGVASFVGEVGVGVAVIGGANSAGLNTKIRAMETPINTTMVEVEGRAMLLMVTVAYRNGRF